MQSKCVLAPLEAKLSRQLVSCKTVASNTTSTACIECARGMRPPAARCFEEAKDVDPRRARQVERIKMQTKAKREFWFQVRTSSPKRRPVGHAAHNPHVTHKERDLATASRCRRRRPPRNPGRACFGREIQTLICRKTLAVAISRWVSSKKSARRAPLSTGVTRMGNRPVPSRLCSTQNLTSRGRI